MSRWHYTGDVSLSYGGLFINLEGWNHDYAEVVEVTDLDSACGYAEANLIERKTINLGSDRVDSALRCCGYKLSDSGDIVQQHNGELVEKKGSLGFKLCLVYAFNAYGFYDIDGSEVVAIGKEAAESFEGFKLNKRLRANASLRSYVRREWLGLSK